MKVRSAFRLLAALLKTIFPGHNPIYYSRRNSFISCAENVMFEKNVTPWHTHYQSSTIQFVYSVKSGTDSRTIFT